MAENQYTNACSALNRQERALASARQTLSGMGIEYPVYDPKKSPIENHDALMAYSQKESELMVKYLKEGDKPRPLEMDNVEPKTQWGRSYYD